MVKLLKSLKSLRSLKLLKPQTATDDDAIG